LEEVVAMRARRLVVIAAALGLALSALAQEKASQGQVMVYEGVTPQNVHLLLSASERMIWDRQTGIAVAEVLGANLGTAKTLKSSVFGPAEDAGVFAAALAANLPEYGRQESAQKQNDGRFAGMQPARMIKPAGTSHARPPARQRATPEDACIYESFENLPIWYEDGGLWWHYQGGQPDNNVGDYFWLDTNCDSFNGDWDCEAIMGGDYGIGLPCGADYDYSTDSWLEFAPWIECLAGAPGAEQRFYAKVQTLDDQDYFFYGFSPTGNDYYGYSYWGNFGDVWYEYHRNLRTWYQLGDLTTYSAVAMAFAFETDVPGNSGFGVRIDDISVNTSPIGIITVQAVGSPFRLFVSGAGFLPGAIIYIDGVPVPITVYKAGTLLVAKGGAALKAMVPRGQWVTISVVNPDGVTSTGYDFIR
jgi:hypothetical protein